MHILFLCTGNSCRSQMAEAWLRHLAAKQAAELKIETSSAGLEAHGLNPGAVKAMADQGIDIRGHSSDIVSNEMIESADLLVTVCAHADANCPLLPAHKQKRHIPFDDPAKATGTDQEIEACFNRVCLEIRDAMSALVSELQTKSA